MDESVARGLEVLGAGARRAAGFVLPEQAANMAAYLERTAGLRAVIDAERRPMSPPVTAPKRAPAVPSTEAPAPPAPDAAKIAARLAEVKAAGECRLARIKRWASRQYKKERAKTATEVRRLERELSESQRIQARLAGHLRRCGGDEDMARTLEEYAPQIEAAEREKMPLDLRVLAHVAPLDLPRPYDDAPAGLGPGTTFDARIAAQLRAGALAPITTWPAFPDAAFPGGVPFAALDGWAVLRALPARHQRRLFHTRWSKTKKRTVYTTRPDRWPEFVRAAAKAVADAVDAANRREPWYIDPRGRTLGAITERTVVRWAYEQRGDRPRRAPGRADKVRKRDSRNGARDEVETALGGRCAHCGRSRADGVGRFHMHHVNGDGGGRGRRVRTDALRVVVRRHVEQHGEPPPGLQLLCERCHTKHHRARTGGQTGSASDVTRTGEVPVTTTSICESVTSDRSSAICNGFSRAGDAAARGGARPDRDDMRPLPGAVAAPS